MKRISKLDEYQEKAMSTLYYFGSKERQLEYAVLALCGETGELANKLKKMIFYKNVSVTKHTKTALIDELSDVLWYVACVADSLNIKLSDVATFNINKILAKEKVTKKRFDTLVESFKEIKGGGFEWKTNYEIAKNPRFKYECYNTQKSKRNKRSIR